MRLRDWAEVPRLAEIYVESEGISYSEAIKKAKEKLLSDRVAAHKSNNNISKTTEDIIPLGVDLDNGEFYDIKTGETIGRVEDGF